MAARSRNWTKDQLKLAFHLYCQLPFGKLHYRNPEIVELARLIGRTPGAVAMKLVNFASLDPEIVRRGRRGLGNASALDREIWEEFHADWNKLALDSNRLRTRIQGTRARKVQGDFDSEDLPSYVGATRRAVVELRVRQQFFRRVVLSSYGSVCCMSGVREPDLLIASHIKPWSIDAANRLNPRNGLCLAALHDRAFDKGLLTVTPKYVVRVSPVLRKQRSNRLIADALLALDGKSIARPERFAPDPAFLEWHGTERFRAR